jgi:hypothetical protein
MLLPSIRRTVFFAAVVVALAGCRRGQEAVVQARIAERVDAFRAKQRAQCREALLSEAESTVDSLLLQEAELALRDSLARGRPAKPFQPGRLAPIDTVKEVKPLFDQ